MQYWRAGLDKSLGSWYTLDMTVLIHYARADSIRDKRTRSALKYEAHGVTDVFVLAESAEQAEQFIAEDCYGLQKRGYQRVSMWNLTQTGGPGQVLRQNGAAAPLGLPRTGCYEACMQVYINQKEKQ